MLIHEAWPYIDKNEHRQSVSHATDRPWRAVSRLAQDSRKTVRTRDSLL